MDLLAKHFSALMWLLFGAHFVFSRASLFGTDRSIRRPVGVALMIMGLLGLSRLSAPECVLVSTAGVMGIYFIWTSIAALCSPPVPSFPIWTQWAILVMGLGFSVAAIGIGLDYYWR
jgi:hypothetical protein